MIEYAKWIWADCEYDVNQYVDFKLEFEIDGIDKNAVMEICADSEYVVWLNGTFAGCGQYHDYPDNKRYDTLPIGDMLRNGRNILIISAYHQGGVSMQYAKGVNAIRFAFNNFDDVYLSDESVYATVNSKYRNGEIFKTTGQVGYGYMFDANILCADYTPAVVKEFNTTLSSRPVKKTEIHNEIPTKIVAQGYFKRAEKDCDNIAHRMYTDFLSHRKFGDMFSGSQILPGSAELIDMQYDGAYVVVDLGKEESGYFTMELSADKGALIEIGYGEHLDDLRVRTEIKTRQFANSYISNGDDIKFTYYFKRIAGRYIELHISNTEKLVINYIGIKPCYYPVTIKGDFKCNDTLHNKIYEVSLNTLKQCMHEHYEDCPWREQALYASDSRNQILCGYYLYEDYDFIRECLSLLADGFGDDGFQNICAPTDERLRIPTFTLLWFLEIAEYTEYTGDKYFEKYWDKIEYAVNKYAENNFTTETSPKYWNFYEWSDGYDGFQDSVQNKLRYDNPDLYDGIYKVFACVALKSVLFLAKEYGKKEFEVKCAAMYENLKAEINDKVWNAEKGVYSSYYYGGKHQHYGELMQVMALFSGVAEGKEDLIYEKLVNPDSDLVKITLSYSLYKYEVLLAAGGKYDKYVFDDIADKWGTMLFKGATSFWETEGGSNDFLLAGSMCHGWSAHPVYLYFRYIMGITPDMLKGGNASERIADVFETYEGYCGNVRVTKKGGEKRDYIK